MYDTSEFTAKRSFSSNSEYKKKTRLNFFICINPRLDLFKKRQKMQKVKTVLGQFVLLQFLIVNVFTLVVLDKNNNSTLDFKWNKECHKKEIKSFSQDLILKHLPHCYITQIHNHEGGFQFDEHLRQLMSIINVNLFHSTANTMFQNFNTKKRRNTIRHQTQCIIYYVVFVPDNDNDQVHLTRLKNIFLHPSFQSQAHESYIFIHNEDESFTQDFALNPALKNYEHKTWITTQNAENEDQKLRFTINNFCYFCKNGYDGILEGNVGLESSSQVENLREIFPDVTSNLYGRALKVTAAMALPFVGILSSPSTKKLRIEGMQATVLKCLESALNFTVILENTSGGLTGSRLPNSSWTGTIGEVLYGRSDIGLNAAPSADRHEYVHFTVSAFYGFLVLVSTKPSPVFEWKAIFYPFEIKAWLGICMSTLITVLAYKFFLTCPIVQPINNAPTSTPKQESIILVSSSSSSATDTSPVVKKDEKEIVDKNSIKVTFLQLYYITIGALLEQGVPFNYFSTPCRIYSLFWFLFTIVATCAYKSKLFSYLTCPIILTPPSTFHELSISSYSWGLKSLGGVALLFVTKSPVSYIRTVGEKMEISMDKYSCMDKTFTEDFVCIIYRAYYDYMSAVRYWKISHRFHVSDYVTPPVGSSWVLPKYSPLLYPLDKNIYLQFEMGLTGIYLEHYIKQMALKSRALAQASNDAKDLFHMNTKFRRKTVKEKPLEFGNLYAGFLALFFGSGLSLLIFFGEQWKTQNKIGIHPHHLLRLRRRRARMYHRGIKLFIKVFNI